MNKKILFILIIFLYSNAYSYHNIGLLMNIPKNSRIEGSDGFGFLYNYSSKKIFDNNKSISLQGGVQISKFRTFSEDSVNSGVDADIETMEKLLSLSFGPRFEFNEKLYFGISLTHNSFYEKSEGGFRWYDSSIGECNDYEVAYEQCEEDFIHALIIDLGLSIGGTVLTTVGNEIKGFVSSNDRYMGFKLHFGILSDNDYTIEMSYNTMPSLKKILTSDESGFLLDFVSSDYFSINFSVPLK